MSSENAEAVVDPKFDGIGGWLFLPAIGFVLGPIVGVIGLIASLGMYSNVAKAGYGGIYTLELLATIVLLGFMLYAATLFFQKKSNAPRTIITFIIVSILLSCVLLVIELVAGAKPFAEENGIHSVRGIIGAAIWIPYFRVSK